MRRSIGLFLAVAGLLAVASPVSAGQPSRDPVVIPPAFLVFAAGTACEFPIHVDVLVNRETIKTWTDEDGNLVRDIISGSLRIRVVNDVTGASTDLNVGGPGRDVYAPDGSLIQYFHGHGLPIFDGVFLWDDRQPRLCPRRGLQAGRGRRRAWPDHRCVWLDRLTAPGLRPASAAELPRRRFRASRCDEPAMVGSHGARVSAIGSGAGSTCDRRTRGLVRESQCVPRQQTIERPAFPRPAP